MRNPFKRRRRLPGATEDWDPSRHVDVGDRVAIPERQLPGRLHGVMITWQDDRPLVAVNITAARAPVDAWSEPRFRAWREAATTTDLAGYAFGETDSPIGEDDYRAAISAALDNPSYWMRDNQAEGTVAPDDEFSFFEVNLTTGHLVAPGQQGAS